jgi:uncharacterized membrane protein
MVIMALDHARDYFSNARFDPSTSRTTPPLFFTRWITHFCAPVFVFLAGTGAFLSGARGREKRELSRFLWTRGLWLVVVEVTIVSFGWSFDFGLHDIALQVIWAIGWSMVVLAVLVHLPTAAVGGIGLAIIALHNLLDPIRPERFGSFDWLWKIVHVQSWTPIASPGGHRFMLVYPLVPWIGVMAAGYASAASSRGRPPAGSASWLSAAPVSFSSSSSCDGRTPMAILTPGPSRRTASIRSCRSSTARNILHRSCIS